ALRLRSRSPVAAALPGCRTARRSQPGRFHALPCQESPGVVRMSQMTTNRNQAGRMPGLLRKIDPAVATSFACIIGLLVFGSLYSTSFLSPEYLLQQLKVASFLGVIATGMMLVILLGQIDLSVPWTVATGAMMASAAAALGPAGVALAIPFGILC